MFNVKTNAMRCLAICSDFYRLRYRHSIIGICCLLLILEVLDTANCFSFTMN